MKLHGHMCLKRTLLWSTSPAIRVLDLGRVQKSKHKSLVKTALKYKDANGVQRYKGSRELKGTQFLGFITFAAGDWKKTWWVCLMFVGLIFHCLEIPCTFWNAFAQHCSASGFIQLSLWARSFRTGTSFLRHCHIYRDSRILRWGNVCSLILGVWSKWFWIT